MLLHLKAALSRQNVHKAIEVAYIPPRIPQQIPHIPLERRLRTAAQSERFSVRPFYIMTGPDSALLQRLVSSEGFQTFLANYNLIFSVFLGIATLSILIFLCINISKLSTSADNDMRRRQAISGILTCLVCLGIAGGMDVVYAILLAIVFNFGG